ncbi:jouberin [Coregonus clupeaformis]|uniref:jouberin n=1 Tax=Coregonus clupeaformis TaxID=59861 RepID=UPI001E1C8015|nr:jouberin [Coregonus clupeaformis]XP_041704154.2 jouberin [Coregonus clupeaformis]
MPAGESEARAKTRASFDEVFKRYTDPATSEKKKVKKKSPAQPEQESIVLQTLKQNLDLVKDTEDDETVLQNIYHAERGSPRFTKNKRREREVTEKVNNNNNGNQDEEEQPIKGKRKGKSTRELPPAPVQQENSYIIQIDQTDSTAGNAKTPKSKASLESEEPGNIQRRKSKKGNSKEGEEEVSGAQSGDAVEAEDELLHEYQQQMAQEEEMATVKKTVHKKSTTDKTNAAAQEVVALNNEGAKKKKKLRSSLDLEEREASMIEDLQNSQSEDVTERKRSKEKSQESHQEEDEEDRLESLKSKGKKKKKIKQVVKEESDTEIAETPQGPVFDDNLVLGVYIHRTDRLKTDLLVSHPMVKIHVIDEMTGQYVKKEDSHRPVSSFYEQESVEHILPIITQPFDFKKNKSTVPEWEEQIIFNERFGYFLQDNHEGPRVMLFFEVLDFMTMEEARANVDVDRHERGFRKIAWAFLKLVGTNGVLNIDSKLRLQLFCPPPRGKRQEKTIEVVDWWRRYPRSRYTSTLYITVKGLKLPDHVDPSIRSMMALQQERGSTSFSELQSEITRRTITQPLGNKPELRWSRMPGQVCRIPNKPMLSFRGGQMGCFTIRFSHNGRRLAAACADRDAFPIIVYEIPSGKVLAAFNGHLSIVYDLCWSRDDRSLLSASSDGTVRVWNVQRFQAIAQKVLPHPSFVYCAQYHPTAQGMVVTAGYDCLVRVWRVDVKDINGLLLQEFDGHKSFINALCFNSEGNRMFSADNVGFIIVWRTSVDDSLHQRPCRHWKIEKEIEECDLNGLPINTLEVHPNGRRLLIHAKDSVVRVMDLRVLAVKKYTGATNYRERIHSTFTPCGSFIFSGSEDGMAYVWNAETGDQVAVYSELCYPTALRGVAFHPHENMVAFCAFGHSQPVHVYLYDLRVAQLEVESLKGHSRSGSADTKMFRNTSDPVTFQDTSGAAMDCFAKAARLSMKMQRVKDKLDSVLEPSQNSSAVEHLYEQGCIYQMGRSLSQEAGPMSLNSSLPPPSLLSPHSKLQLSGSLGAQFIPQAPLTSQNRGFSPVGQHLGRTPSLRLQTSFPDHLSTAIRVEADSLVPVQQTVVSLYDYSATRSDELTVQRGDVIHVLYKDNDNWWFGRLANGQQGYFPATYVAEERDYNEELSQALKAQSALSEQTDQSAPLSEPRTDLSVPPSERTDQSDERLTPTKVSAAVVSGELKFISELDTDPEQPAATKVKKKKKKLVKKLEAPSSPASVSDPDAPGTSSTRRRAKAAGSRPLPPSPRTGQSNSTLEPDT